MTTTIQTPIQILEDGPRNVVIKYEGSLTSTDAGTYVIVDPAALSEVQNILTEAGIIYTEPIGVCEAASHKRIVISA